MEKGQRIETLQAELARIEIRRQDLVSQIARHAKSNASADTRVAGADVTHLSAVSDKVRLFRTLFRGRQDVYPRRFESQRTGKSGYQPVCKNEWITGVCRKTHVKYGDCPAREYMPVTDQVIEWHLRGNDPNEYPAKEFVVGVYPMLQMKLVGS